MEDVKNGLFTMGGEKNKASPSPADVALTLFIAGRAALAEPLWPRRSGRAALAEPLQ